MDSRSSAFSTITYLKDIDLSRRDYTVKVRVISLWKQPMFNNKAQWYSIEMIVVDEEGTRMQASVLRRWFPQFEHILKESSCYFICKPTIGLNESRYTYVDNPNKLGIYCDTKVYLCTDFTGPSHAFSFTSFKHIVEKTLPENHPVDVIGFVADVKEVKNLKTKNRNDIKKVNVIIQDLNMETIYLCLWNSYADRVIEFWQNREEHGVIILILQFGWLKYYLNSAYVNNAFDVSKLFLNSDNDETTTFTNNLLQTCAMSSSFSQSSKLFGKFLSMYDDYIVRIEFNNIAEVNLDKVRSVVILGTIRKILTTIPWYYISCKNCNKKVTKKDYPSGVSFAKLLELQDVYECDTERCLDKVIVGVQREAVSILKKDSDTLVEKYLSGGDKGLYPDEFEYFIEKKYAFKIDVT